MESGLSLAWDKVQGWSESFYQLLPNILAGLVILFLFLFIGYISKRLIDTYFKRRERIDLGHLVSDISFWALMIMGALVALTIITPSIKPVDLISGLGLGSLAIGFAFKDILQNWLSGLLILLRLPFRRGDQIQVGENEGTVLRIEPRATIIRTYDGKDIVIPNTKIYSSDVVIQTSQPTRRIEITITVGYDYDIRFVRDIILRALQPIEEIHDDPEPQILCWELGATSLGLKIRWWINSERSQEIISRARAIQAIKEAFQANDIDPTDPDLVYTVRSSASEIDEDEAKREVRPASPKSIKTVQPPEKLEMGAEDPETYTPKEDSKNETLLPED
jgi:small-conductance mechanosensitive channel